MSKDEIRALKRAYLPFQSRISFQEFVKKANSLAVDKWDFVRASLLYQQALKCKSCEPNIAMVLLCSCADALKTAGKNAGSRKNFKDFYLNHCPSALRVPPLNYYPQLKPPAVVASFDKALDFIYSKFRCLFVHEGKGRLSQLPKGIAFIGSFLLDMFENIPYHLDTIKLTEWFERITLESLYELLV